MAERNEVSRIYRRLMGMALEQKSMKAKLDSKAKQVKTKNTDEALEIVPLA